MCGQTSAIEQTVSEANVLISAGRCFVKATPGTHKFCRVGAIEWEMGVPKSQKFGLPSMFDEMWVSRF